MDGVLERLNVSRETVEALQSYASLVEKWTARINLVSTRSRDEIWSRHVLDSAQLFALPPEHWTTWVDLGAGGGFPGMVIAILAMPRGPDKRVTLVESDRRKGAFLHAAAADLGIPVTILIDRAESIGSLQADVVSARALAPLDRLLGLCQHHLAEDGIAILPKGKRAEEEIAEARKLWHFDLTAHPSQTDPDARILMIERLTRA
jgi:16S rRNA (guanine527-N7)-methyltransferase